MFSNENLDYVKLEQIYVLNIAVQNFWHIFKTLNYLLLCKSIVSYNGLTI